MKNATLIPNLLLAGAMAFGSAAMATETVTWFEGGVDTSWPAQAAGGAWYCQNLANLKWTETFVPSVDKKVPGVTLDNWAYVGLKFTAAERLSLGLGGGVTEASFSTTVLLTPIMKDDLPGFDADDKGGVILVHEDDGSLRYYVLAQSDEENGSGANVWKRAGSIPRVTDDAPATIGIRLHQDGKRWLVDYTVNGATEASRVVAVGLAPTLSALRFTGPCTVQALSGSYVAYPAWLDTENPVELAKYDTWAAKYGVTDVAQALQKAYLLDCANTAEAIAAAKLTAATVWLDGGVDAQWPNHTTGGQWRDVGARTWSASAQGVGLGASATAMTFAAGEALALDTAAGQAGATVTTRVTFVPHTQLPAVESDDVTGLVLLQETNGFRYYVIAQQDEQTGAGANVWKATRDLPVLSAAPTTPATVSVRIFSRGGQCQAEYTVDGVAETAHVVAVGSTPTLGRVSYSGSGTLAYLAATLGGGDVEPHDHAWTATAAGSQLTATCTAENCPFVTAVLSLTGTETKVADGTPLTATLEGSSAFVAKTGATVGSVAYFQGTTQLAGAPTEAGSYEARVTVQLAGSAYTLTRALTISEPPPAARYDITVTTPSNGTLTTSPSGSVAAGTTVTVTATAAEGYELKAVTVNGTAITGMTFTMPAEAVMVAATFVVKPSAMFTLGGTGYDSFADVMAAAKNGDTIQVGANATFSMSALGGKSITFDLCGQTLTWESGGYVSSGSITVVDSGAPAGRFVLDKENRNYQTRVDMSALSKEQLTGSGKFWSGTGTTVVFPSDMPFDDCMKFMDNRVDGEHVVVKGVTYTYDAATKEWVSENPPPAPTTYAITVMPPQNGTLVTSPSGSVAAGTTVTVTATAAEGYELKAVTVNGTAITGMTFTMPAEAVTVAATFEKKSGGDPQPEPAQMFYIGTTGYDSWASAYGAAKNGDTITVGKNASFSVSGGKAITIDLCGRSATWNAGGYAYTGAIKIVDSGTPAGSGRLTLAGGNQNTKTEVDLSALSNAQVSGSGTFYFDPATKIVFPRDMPYAECMKHINFQDRGAGSQIVVQGVTYEWDGSAWISKGGKVYPEWIDAASTAETGKYDAWAAAKGVTDPTAALEEAYLLNCANTAAAVAEAKTAFKITRIAVGANDAVELGLPEGDFNGTITVLGCETVNGTYHVKKVGDHFFKAILGK